MFTKLKKKIAEEAAIVPRPGGAARIPRSISKESITSAGADSGDDFASDGSSSRDDLPSQISRRNDQIRRLEAKLSATVRKFQEQNEAHQAHRAKMAEEHALALEKKDQEWLEKIADLEEEKKMMSSQIDLLKKKSVSLFQKGEDLDELEVFQQQEMAKIKHMLLNKEALLSQVEQELDLLRTEVVVSRAECQDAQELSARLKEDLQKVQEENDQLSQQRTALTNAEEGAEKKITELEQRQRELQDFIQKLSLDLQKAQSVGCSSEKRLTEVGVEIEEKDVLIERLQERVNSLEKTLEGRFSGNEGLQELLKEKDTLEMKLDETRQQLSETRTQHSDSVAQMELQVTTLNGKLQEAQDLLQQKQVEFSCFEEGSSQKLNELEQTLRTVQERLKDQEEELKQQEERMISYDQLGKEMVSLKEKNINLEAALEKHKVNQENIKEELNSSETMRVETAKSLEETQKQKEDLQQQVADLHARIQENTQEISLKNEDIIRRDEEAAHLKRDYDALVLQMQQLHTDLEMHKTRAAQTEDSSVRHVTSVSHQPQEQKAVLRTSESQVSALHEPLPGRESNGEVAIDDIPQLQRENQELERQIAEKNKTIKQLQQRMVELKKTLQRELKLKPDPEVNDVREKANPDPLATSITVTSSSDLTDSREINFEYLKHVVLKFMSARETEAFHLIKAVSVLLNFSVEEENLLKETLEYKMSWFGSKPAPKGTVRPSISKSRTTWS